MNSIADSIASSRKLHSRIFMFEERFLDSEYVLNLQKWMYANWYKSILFAVLYIFIVFTGQCLMKSRPKFELRPPLAIWNLFLASFSILGFLRVAPEFIYVLKNHGMEYSVCNSSNAYGVTGYWTWMFCVSKVPELVDTVFIVLRKQPLIFLHWFHHATVLIYSWYSYQHFTSSGRWFVVMNYAVHGCMYTYYALKSLKFKVPVFVSMTITLLQLSQMLVGCYINYLVWQIKKAGRPCNVSDENVQYSFIMYFTYFILFAHFFATAYVCSNSRKKKVSRKSE